MRRKEDIDKIISHDEHIMPAQDVTLYAVYAVDGNGNGNRITTMMPSMSVTTAITMFVKTFSVPIIMWQAQRRSSPPAVRFPARACAMINRHLLPAAR